MQQSHAGMLQIHRDLAAYAVAMKSAHKRVNMRLRGEGVSTEPSESKTEALRCADIRRKKMLDTLRDISWYIANFVPEVRRIECEAILGEEIMPILSGFVLAIADEFVVASYPRKC